MDVNLSAMISPCMHGDLEHAMDLLSGMQLRPNEALPALVTLEGALSGT